MHNLNLHNYRIIPISQYHLEHWIPVITATRMMIVLPSRLVLVDLDAPKDVCENPVAPLASLSTPTKISSDSRKPRINQQPQDDAMSFVVQRPVNARIRKSRHKASTVGNRQLQRRSCCPFVVTSRVIRVPDENTRHAAVHPDSHETGHAEPDIGRRDVADDRVANDGDEKSEEHDDTPELETVRGKSYGDRDWRGHGVGNHGPQLTLVGVGCDFEVVDNRWEEQAEAVKSR